MQQNRVGVVSLGPALALIEVSSVATGIVVADAMVKRAAVELLRAGTIHPGHFLVLVAGPVGEVEEATDAGMRKVGSHLLDTIFLPDVHQQVVAALRGKQQPASGEALGVVEAATVSSVVEAADAGVKGTAARLRLLRLGDGLGGKGYLLFSGPVAEVEAAVAIAAGRVEPEHLVDAQVIASLHDEMEDNLASAARFRDLGE